MKKVRRTTIKTSGACIRSTRIIYCRIYRLADMQRDLFCPVAMMDPPKSNQCRFPTFLEWIHILFPISADFPPTSNGFISCSQSVPISPLPQMDSYLVPNQCRFPPFLNWIHILFLMSADSPPSSNGFMSKIDHAMAPCSILTNNVVTKMKATFKIQRQTTHGFEPSTV